jgi:uncharacterized membrane protein
MVIVKIFYYILGLTTTITIFLTSFEITLHLFHSPLNSTIIEPKAHSSTWIYLLKQKYISFIDLDIFTIREKRHLLDVKRLFDKIYIIWEILTSISILIFTYLYFKSKEILNIAIRYSLNLGVVLNIIFILISFNFLEIFKTLHQIIFPNNSWTFPKESILIEWFPLIYFIEFFAILILLNLSIHIIIKRET